jgi:hypothetical protein
MRSTGLVVASLLLGTCLVCQAAEPPAAAGALCPKEAEQGFKSLFDGKTLEGWQGKTKGYKVDGGVMICEPGGNIFTAKEYADFVFRFEFKLPPLGNNGVGIRTPLKGNPAYVGMEIQILDDAYKKKYPQLQPYQVHGSIYGVVPAKPGHQKPIGEWNCEEIMCKGSHVKVTLNGVVIVDADLDKVEKTLDGREHPGLHNEKGYIGFLGHGSRVEFRNIRIKELE